MKCVKTQREIYKQLFEEAFILRSMVLSESEDTLNRKANLSAVKNTVRVWQEQFKENK